jgi:hypothetical protein
MAADKNLIAGTRVMLEAGRDTSVSSFAREFNTILKSQVEEEAKETADIDRWLNKVGTPDNIRKIDESYRGEVENWVSTKQEEYIRLNKSYQKDQNLEDKRAAELIERQFMNLNDQLNELQLDKEKYFEAGTKRKLKTGVLGSEWYVNNYLEKDDASTTDVVEGGFTISEDGMVMFGDDSFDSKKGNWNVKNTLAENFIADQFVAAKISGKKDGKTTSKSQFVRTNVVKKTLGSQDPEDILVLVQTDLNTEDDQNFTFAQQWASGDLKNPAFYDFKINNKDFSETTLDERNNWMQNPDNKDKIVDLISMYVDDTREEIYNIEQQNSFNETNNMSFLDIPGKGLFVGGTNQTATRSSGETLLKELKEGKGKLTNFLGRSITFDPINDVYTTIYEGETNTYQGLEDFLGALGITDPAFRNIVPKKSKNDNNDNNDNNNNNNNKNITLDMSLVTSTVDDNLFKRFEEVAPGFSFKPMLSETTQQPIKDRYIVTAPNGGTLKIHLNRSISKESTRKKLETFFNNNRIQ